ncbi:MAG: hypothetical protein R2856_06845 [Caldilineaceae bacterium]
MQVIDTLLHRSVTVEELPMSVWKMRPHLSGHCAGRGCQLQYSFIVRTNPATSLDQPRAVAR